MNLRILPLLLDGNTETIKMLTAKLTKPHFIVLFDIRVEIDRR